MLTGQQIGTLADYIEANTKEFGLHPKNNDWEEDLKENINQDESMPRDKHLSSYDFIQMYEMPIYEFLIEYYFKKMIEEAQLG